MAFPVLLAEDAERDLEGLYDYLAKAESKATADRMLEKLLKLAGDLADFPERGSHPQELLALGITDYRQAIFKPYRLIYRIHDARVFVYLVADGRRDMQSLLAQRLLGA